MTPKEAFLAQVQRLRANYGADRFPDEKCALIWEELSSFSAKQVTNICSVIMGECQFAPVLSHFREKAALLREKIRQWERDQQKREATRFWQEHQLPEMGDLDEGDL